MAGICVSAFNEDGGVSSWRGWEHDDNNILYRPHHRPTHRSGHGAVGGSEGDGL